MQKSIAAAAALIATFAGGFVVSRAVDGPGPATGAEGTQGPIATAWEVFGWPSIYVLGQEGVIRHVNPRGGELLATLDDMLIDIRRARCEAERAAAAEAETAIEHDTND